jgi:hypothetical protein
MAPEAPDRAATAEKRAVPTLVPEIRTISFTEIPDGRFSSGTDRETPVGVAILARVVGVGQAAEERHRYPVHEKIAGDDTAEGDRPLGQGLPDLGHGDGRHGAFRTTAKAVVHTKASTVGRRPVGGRSECYSRAGVYAGPTARTPRDCNPFERSVYCPLPRRTGERPRRGQPFRITF